METIQRGGAVVDPYGLGFGQPGDWYYTRWIYPDDVREAKRRVDAKYQSVNKDVQVCKGLTDGERSAWNDLFAAWRKIYCRSDTTTCTDPDVSLWGLGGQMDDVERYEKYVYDWQRKLETKTCAVSGPIEKPDIVTREESEKRADVLGTVKYVLAAVAVTAGIVYVVPTIVKLIPERKKT